MWKGWGIFVVLFSGGRGVGGCVNYGFWFDLMI